MKRAEILYRMLYAGTLSIVILFCFSDLLDIAHVNWKHIIILSVSVIIFCAACLLGGRQRIYAAVLGCVVFLFLFLSIGSERCLTFFGSVLNFPSTDYEIPAEEWIYIELGRVFLLTLFCYLAQLLFNKNIYLKLTCADAVGGWMLYMQKVPRSGVVFFILYTAATVTEWIRCYSKKTKNDHVQAYVLSILPFLIIYVVLLSFMPMQDAPYDWQWAKKIYQNAEAKITMYAENFGNIGNEYFDGTTSGFSEEGGFFSDVWQDNRQLMTLGIGREKDMPIYLVGKVFDSFDGREWKSGEKDRDGIQNRSEENIGNSERILDAMETLYALQNYAGGDVYGYYKNIRLDVSYRYFHTNYLMAPSKTWKINDTDKRIKYHLENNDFVFNRKAGYGTVYTLQFFRMNMDREELYRFLETYAGGDLDKWTDITVRYIGKRIPIEELFAYRDKMEERYLPETSISPEAEEWISSVTADAESDVERLFYIESALSAMAYNTSPGKLPETVTDGERFLDYFLLEKREGYCAHFATAFVLLARAEGFPARYVQGFCVPLVRGDETFVYSDMAHAWPEVYIRGKGWIAFEPTPGFGVNRYAAWTESTDRDGWISYTESASYHTQEGVSASEDGTVHEDVPEERKGQEKKKSVLFWSYLFKVVWILLIGGILAFMIDRLIEKHREKRRNLSEKYRLAVLHNFRILDMLGYKRELAETYHELAERIRQGNVDTDRDRKENAGKEENKISYGFIESYEHYLYGTLEIDEQILTEVLAERKQLIIILKKFRGKTYLLCMAKLYVMRYR